MTVTLYSITPPTSHSSRYLLRPTQLNGPNTALDYQRFSEQDTEGESFRRAALAVSTLEVKAKHTDEPLAEDDLKITLQLGGPLVVPGDTILDDIDSMYDQTLEDPVGLLEKSAEITRFP